VLSIEMTICFMTGFCHCFLFFMISFLSGAIGILIKAFRDKLAIDSKH